MDYYGSQIGFRGEVNSTVQHWWFSTDARTDIVADSYMNPYGTPMANVPVDAEWADDWPARVPPGTEPGEVPGWHMPHGGTTIYLLHNNPMPNAQKIIIAQVTASKEPLSVTLELPPDFTYKTFDTGFPTVQWVCPAPFDGSWTTSVYGFQVDGNPEWESIQVHHPPCTTLDQTVIDTICIPEPSSLMMFGCGFGMGGHRPEETVHGLKLVGKADGELPAADRFLHRCSRYNAAMKIISLQSGSNGHCIYVEADGVRLLFDAGISGIQWEQLRSRNAVRGGYPEWLKERIAGFGGHISSLDPSAYRNPQPRMPRINTNEDMETADFQMLAAPSCPECGGVMDLVAFLFRVSCSTKA